RTMQGEIAIFSHGHFGRVLGARWIGLSVGQAQCFLLSTASISVLDYEHDRVDQPVIAIWNAGSDGMFGSVPSSGVGDARTMKQRAIERWENEGGEIPRDERNKTAS
ncbi:MAG: histidine phosphatase family protein, partial [Acidobacteriota bacterium]